VFQLFFGNRGRLELCYHLIEALRQQGHLALAVPRNTISQVSLGDSLHSVAQLLHGITKMADKPPARANADEDKDRNKEISQHRDPTCWRLLCGSVKNHQRRQTNADDQRYSQRHFSADRPTHVIVIRRLRYSGESRAAAIPLRIYAQMAIARSGARPQNSRLTNSPSAFFAEARMCAVRNRRILKRMTAVK
jgi:hypothetical protein